MSERLLMSLQRVTIAPDQGTLSPGANLTLTVPQHHYLQRVLRLQVGDRFIAMDGQTWWLATLETPHQAEILEAVPVDTELAIAIAVLIAMPKQGMDDIVRQVTELGAHLIIPVQSDRTLLQPSAQKVQRWQRIVQEAAEQSERQQIPQLWTPLRFDEAIAATAHLPSPCHAYLCTARGDRPSLLAQMLQSQESGGTFVLAIGPEGGWTDAEQRLAQSAGYQPVSLGRRILRSITAPGAAVAIAAAAIELGSTSAGQTSEA